MSLHTMMRVSRSIIIPSITYRFPIRPPAHRGPRIVARPPTERRTPWLKPADTHTYTHNTKSLESAHRFEYLNSDNKWHLYKHECYMFTQDLIYLFLLSFSYSQWTFLCFSPCVFSAVTLEKSPVTAGTLNQLMNSINSNEKPPDQNTYPVKNESENIIPDRHTF